jgi:hypothetical protein
LERLKELGKSARANPDAASAIVIAALAVILGLLGLLSDDRLSEAVLAVLVLVSVGLLLDRNQRDEISENIADVRRGTDRLETAVIGLERSQRGGSYEVLNSHATWEIADRGASVIGSKRRSLRFLRDDQVAITDFSRVDAGYASNPQVDEPLEYVRTILDKAGTKHALIALDKAYDDGETVEVSLRRAFQGSFLAETETVAHRIEAVTREIAMTVIWPIDRPPVAPLSISSSLTPALNRTVPLERLDVELDGRRSFTWSSEGGTLLLGDRITIAWRW